MAASGGLALKSVSLFLRLIQFCCAALIIGIFSYFLATLHNHHLHIATYIRAVEGISGAGVLYTLAGLILVCCLGGITFFSLLAILLDIAFAGAFIYVAYATRGGASSCKGHVNTPFGSGNVNTNNAVATGSSGFTHLPSLKTACKLETATFVVAIVGAVFFLLSVLAELGLMKHHRKERAFGPSPNNGYTAGSPKRKFWQRKPKRDAEYGEKHNPDALPPHTAPTDVRDSYATESTAVGNEPVLNKYGNSAGYANTGNIAGYTSTGVAHTTAGHHSGTVMGTGANGYQTQTTTTTHVPHHTTTTTGGTYQAYNPNNTVPNNNGTF